MNLTRFIPLPTKIRNFLQLQRGILVQYGWLKSSRANKPVDGKGNPVPWFTYPAIDFLTQFDFSDRTVFEWGAGQSTLFWSTHAKSVVSIENNPEWADYLQPLLSENCELILSTPDNDTYVNQIERYGKFDVIVIDGTDYGRPPGARLSVKHLNNGGWVILDNSDQCLQSARILRESGLVEIDFTGFSPGGGYAHTTSIFFRGTHLFNSLNGQPVRSVAQPNPPWPLG